jgi:hypothetical protein
MTVNGMFITQKWEFDRESLFYNTCSWSFATSKITVVIHGNMCSNFYFNPFLQASYTAVVLFAYYDVKNNHPNEQPLISYWPVDSFEFGVPYVHIKGHFTSSPEQQTNGLQLSKNKMI